MKRKFKLFATLASLCLSVALMAFGVYAATNVTYNVNSSVTFAAQVAGIWSSTVETGTLTNGSVVWTEVDTDSWTLEGGELEVPTAPSHTWDVNEDAETPAGPVSLVFNPGAAKNYVRYTIRFQSQSARATQIAASLATGTALFSNAGLTVRIHQAKGSTAPTIPAAADNTLDATAGKTLPAAAELAANEYYLLVIEVQLTNFKVSLNEGTDNILNLVMTALAEGQYTPANNG